MEEARNLDNMKSDLLAFLKEHPFPIFSEKIGDGIYLISEERVGMDGKGQGRDVRHFGAATGNSYLILGNDTALLIDTACISPGIRKEVERLAEGRSVMPALSHAHVDHTFHLEEFDEVWLHPADEGLLHGAYGWEACEKAPRTLHYLTDGDVVDLGGREVEIYWIPGHTDGSILFYDKKTRLLFSGDAIARRNLYGSCGHVLLGNWLRSLYRMNALEIDGIYSAHDRPCLPKSYINHEIGRILTKLPDTERVTNLKAGKHDKYLWLLTSSEEDPWMVDFAAPLEWRGELLRDVENCLQDPLFLELLREEKRCRRDSDFPDFLMGKEAVVKEEDA
jgi:glyoxylase-like metal-dependent hydrolase (beta-lactamase superfamily II)